jgi:hypothetical protein
MKRRISIIAASAIVIAFVIAIALAPPIHGSQKYEVNPIISVPAYKTDATRAIEAYERMMENYMFITEKHFSNAGRDIEKLSAQLGSIDAKLTQLSSRLARIEEQMGITPPAPVVDQQKPDKPKEKAKPKDQPKKHEF